MVEAQGMHLPGRHKAPKVTLGGKVTRMPRHPSKEIKTGTYQSILDDLGLQPDK
ncbi:MAG: type II toxin-antitoxin system HicA family toxin [Bryobacterales bacterium]|nr:type II toxin-antitoxin system HicA family toxin [Bryobacterales bacterium]